MMNHLWLGMNLKDAIAAPILFVDSQNNVNFEPGFDKVTYFHPVDDIQIHQTVTAYLMNKVPIYNNGFGQRLSRHNPTKFTYL